MREESCGRCHQTVYAMEGIRMDDTTIHRSCFKCVKCKKILTLQSYVSSKGSVYCAAHKPSTREDDGGRFIERIKAPAKRKETIKEPVSLSISEPCITDVDMIVVDCVPTHPLISSPIVIPSIAVKVSPESSVISSVVPSISSRNSERDKPLKIQIVTSNNALTGKDVEYWESKANFISPILSKPAEMDEKSFMKIDALIQSYHKVKLYSVHVIKCCDKLNAVTQDGRIVLLQDFVSHFRLVRDSLRKFIDATISVVSSLDLRRNGVEMLKYEILMTTEFLLGNGTSVNAEEFRKLFQMMNTNIDAVMRKYQPASKMMVKTSTGFKEESCFDGNYFIAEEVQYSDVVLEHLVDCQHFRKTFLSKDHHTFIGTLEKLGPVIISVVREDEESLKQTEKSIYKIILRLRDIPERHGVFQASQVRKSFLGRKASLRQVLQLLDKDINFSKLKHVDTDRHIEARLISLDEFKYRPRYKFGVILCKPGQTTDNEYFSNISGSPAYDTFLKVLGTCTELLGFKGFSGGLDTVYGKTGSHFIYTKYRENEIMYHCSTMLPFKDGDLQQIERKRHIGNGTFQLIVDIVNIIYLDGDMQFDPSSVKTQFTHVYILVKQEMIKSSGEEISGYRVAISSSTDVAKFGPPLPNPPVFSDLTRLSQFLIAKLVNSENASLKAPKFSKPNDRAHHALFDDIIEEFSGSNSARKISRKSTDELAPVSPIARLFSSHLSVGRKKASRQSINGSMSDLKSDGQAQSPRFLRDVNLFPKITAVSASVLVASPVALRSEPREKEDAEFSLTNAETIADLSPLRIAVDQTYIT